MDYYYAIVLLTLFLIANVKQVKGSLISYTCHITNYFKTRHSQPIESKGLFDTYRSVYSLVRLAPNQLW